MSGNRVVNGDISKLFVRQAHRALTQPNPGFTDVPRHACSSWSGWYPWTRCPWFDKPQGSLVKRWQIFSSGAHRPSAYVNSKTLRGRPKFESDADAPHTITQNSQDPAIRHGKTNDLKLHFP